MLERIKKGAEQELSNEQIGALLCYFGIDSGDSIESIKKGIEALSLLQRS